MPALYLSHGAPPLVDDELWVSQLAAWAADLPVPSAILVVSAHWEAAPLTIGSTTVETPLTYDFWGFPRALLRRHLRRAGRACPGRDGRSADARRRTRRPRSRPQARPRRVRPADRHVSRRRHPGAADIDADAGPAAAAAPRRAASTAARRRRTGDRVRVHHARPAVPGRPVAGRHAAGVVGGVRRAGRPSGSPQETSTRSSTFGTRRPGCPYAHPTIEHFAPLFVALGASGDPEQAPRQVIDGYWMGLAKRSIQLV